MVVHTHPHFRARDLNLIRQSCLPACYWVGARRLPTSAWIPSEALSLPAATRVLGRARRQYHHAPVPPALATHSPERCTLELIHSLCERRAPHLVGRQYRHAPRLHAAIACSTAVG